MREQKIVKNTGRSSIPLEYFNIKKHDKKYLENFGHATSAIERIRYYKAFFLLQCEYQDNGYIKNWKKK